MDFELNHSKLTKRQPDLRVIRLTVWMKITFLFRFGVLAFLVAGTVAAQQPQAPTDPSTVLTMQGNRLAQLAASWLHSGDPRMEAWGAYVALRDRRKELIPDLLALADRYEVAGLPVLNPNRAQHDAMLAILDALIQLSAAVSGNESKKLYPEFPTQSLILLGRAWTYPDSLDSSNRILLEIFRTEHFQPAWLAAGNILAQRMAEGFAAAVLDKMTVHMSLLVTSPHGPMGGIGSSACGDSGGELPSDRADWPEIGYYSLVNPGSGATLLADGADPSYYMRKVDRLYDRDLYNRGGQCNGVMPNSWDILREHYITRLLGEPQDTPPLKVSIYRTMIWENSKTYLAYMRNFVTQQQSKFGEVEDKLRNCHLMTTEEIAALKLHIEITIADNREEKTTPLPRPENFGENVTIKM